MVQSCSLCELPTASNSKGHARAAKEKRRGGRASSHTLLLLKLMVAMMGLKSVSAKQPQWYQPFRPIAFDRAEDKDAARFFYFQLHQ